MCLESLSQEGVEPTPRKPWLSGPLQSVQFGPLRWAWGHMATGVEAYCCFWSRDSWRPRVGGLELPPEHHISMGVSGASRHLGA